ncbi:MAG: MFS transporter [Rhodospirillales bacterium]|nr:MFS transporter [Rhodospirillales bacterium]
MTTTELAQRTVPSAAWVAWIAWLCGASFYCYGFFQRVAPSVMVGDLMRDFGVSGAVLGNLTAFYFYAYAGLQIPVGVMVDRFGPRRMLTAAAILCTAGSWLFATADSLGLAYAGRALIGAGAGVAWIGTLQIAAFGFPARRFALLTGLTLLLGMAGGVGGQTPLAFVIGTAGWRPTLLGATVVAAVLALLIWGFVRTDAAPGGRAAHVDGGVLRGLVSVLATPQSWACAIFGAGMAVPVLAFAGLWGVPYMMEMYGLTRPTAAFTTTLMLVGWAIGAPVAGWISDHLGRRRAPMVVSSMAALATLAAALYLPGLPLLAVQGLLLVHGIFSGAMVLSFATARENNRPRVSATAVGFVNMAVMAMSAGFQPLIGWLLDLGWDGRLVDGGRVYAPATFKAALVTLLVAGVVACLAALMTRETRCRPVAGAD